jgi:hypothetical protein
MLNPRVSIVWNGTAFVLSHINANGTSTTRCSIDGEYWENAATPDNTLVSNQIANIKWSGNRIMLLGNLATTAGNVSLTSADGGFHYGTTRPTTSGQIGQLYDIETNAEFRNTLRFPHRAFLALGTSAAPNSETIAYSLNGGDTWTPSGNGVFSISANAAKWNGRIWVAVGQGNTNTIATSTDGTQWIGRGKNAFTEEGRDIDWSKELCRWVAVGNGAPVAHSVDGVHWLGRSVSGMASGNSVRWNGSIWVMSGVPSSGASGRSIAYSLDGDSWASVPDMFSVQATRVEWDGAIWSVYGEDPSWNIATSSNGMNWQKQYIESASLPTTHSRFYDETRYWESSGNTYSVSVDAANWATRSSITDMSLSEIRQFVANTPNEGVATIMPIAVATGEGQNTMAYSYDGIYWTGLGETIFSERANQAVWNGHIWVAVGKGGHSIATSYDGIEWRGRESAIFSEGYSVAWNGVRFVAVGKGNTATIATSADGIYWDPVANSADIFTEHASKICWTGKAWLAYGSGGNTTAMSLDGSSWTMTPEKNAMIMDASSIFQESGYFTSSASVGGYTASSSTAQTGYEAYRVFDNTAATQWKSGATYTATTGVYDGTETTTYTNAANQSLTASGEWVQLAIPSAKQIRYYSATFATDNNTASIPRKWRVLGSTNGSTWTEIDSFLFETESPPNNTWKTARFTSPINLYDNSGAYSYYRLVVESTFGGASAAITEIDLFMENAGSASVSRYETPIVLRNSVLFMTNIVSFSGVAQSVYRLADLSLNTLAHRPTNGGEYVNSAIYDLSAPTITSVCFDGENTFLTDISGVVVAITNEAANTHYNMDSSLNGFVINSRLSAVYSSCWNQQFVLFAGEGGISYGRIGGTDNQWNLTNAGDLFTNVYGVASNSGFGFVHIPNVIYLHGDDILKLVGPKAQSFQGETAIHFNLHNSNKL